MLSQYIHRLIQRIISCRFVFGIQRLVPGVSLILWNKRIKVRIYCRSGVMMCLKLLSKFTWKLLILLFVLNRFEWCNQTVLFSWLSFVSVTDEQPQLRPWGGDMMAEGENMQKTWIKCQTLRKTRTSINIRGSTERPHIKNSYISAVWL